MIIAPLSNMLGGLIGGLGGGLGGGIGSAFSGLGASLGGEALTGGIQAASAASLVPTLPLFAGGGWTGNTPAHKIAGFAHGQEYVFDANATKRIGVGKLEAIRRGWANPANDRMNGDTFAPVININAPMTRREARETASQAAAAFQNRIAIAKRNGM